MTFTETVNFIFNHQILIAAILGAVIGLEREIAGKDPSLRTFALLCAGSCIFTILSVYSAEGVVNAEPSRIAAQILPGIGFLGAGAIFRSQRGVSGLTTAALIWVTAGIGMACGFGRIDIALSSTVIALLITVSLRIIHWIIRVTRKESDTSSTTRTTKASANETTD